MRTQVECWLEKIQTGTELWQATGINNRIGNWCAPGGSVSPASAPPEGGSLYNTAAVRRALLEFVEISIAMCATEDAERYPKAADAVQHCLSKRALRKSVSRMAVFRCEQSAARMNSLLV